MNDLTTYTDKELELELAIQEDRIKMFETDEGKRLVAGEMLKLLGMIEQCGYKLRSGDKTAIAKIWANTLKEQIIRIGYTGVKEAAVIWVKKDDSDYMTFPKASWIEKKCKELKGDPRVEKGRREFERELAKIEQEHRDEMNAWKAEHPEEWKEMKGELRNMNVTGKTRIFRHVDDGRVSYSRCIASKEYKDGHQTDRWIRTYERVQLPKGDDLADKTVIDIEESFEAVTEYKDKVYRKLVVKKYKVAEEEKKPQEGAAEPEPDYDYSPF